MKKKLLTLVLGAALAVSSMAGCGQTGATEIVANVGDQEITSKVANFYARFEQAQYETYYADLLGKDMWINEAEPGKTYEESVKDSIMDALTSLYVLEQHAPEYSVEITEDEQKEIDAKAKEFVEENSKEAVEAVSGDEDTVKEILGLLNIQNKMYQAMTADVNKEVSDEEAAQKSLQYVYFPLANIDENGQEVPMTDEEKAAIKDKALKFHDGAVTAPDFEAFATANEMSASSLTFDKDTTTPSAELIEAAVALKAGELTGVIEGSTGYYVAKVTSELDRAATDAKKEEIVITREQEAFEKLVEKWVKDTDIKVNKNVWNKISFKKQGITVKQPETK